MEQAPSLPQLFGMYVSPSSTNQLKTNYLPQNTHRPPPNRDTYFSPCSHLLHLHPTRACLQPHLRIHPPGSNAPPLHGSRRLYFPPPSTQLQLTHRISPLQIPRRHWSRKRKRHFQNKPRYISIPTPLRKRCGPRNRHGCRDPRWNLFVNRGNNYRYIPRIRRFGIRSNVSSILFPLFLHKSNLFHKPILHLHLCISTIPRSSAAPKYRHATSSATNNKKRI